MGGNSLVVADRRDDAQLPEIVHRAQGPEWTLDGLVAFVSRGNHVEIARKWEKEDVVKLVNATDQVRPVGFREYPPDDDVGDQTLESTDLGIPQVSVVLRALGSICSVTGQLPHTAILSSGLQKCGDIAVASGGFTDTWRGRYGRKNVALKAFRTYPSQDLKEAKKARKNDRCKHHSGLLTPLAGSLEASARLETTVSRKRPTIPWRRHDKFSACPRL